MFFRLLAPPVLQLLSVLLVLFSLVSPVPLHTSSISLIYISAVPQNDVASSSNSTAGEGQAITLMPVNSRTSLPTEGGQPVPNVTAPATQDTLASEATKEPTLPHTTPSAIYTSIDGHLSPVTPAATGSVSLPPVLATQAPQRRLFARDSVIDTAGSLAATEIQYAIGLLGACYRDVNSTYHCTPSQLHPHMDHAMLADAPGLHINTASLPPTWTAQPVLILLTLLVVIVTSAMQARRVHILATDTLTSLSRNTMRCCKMAMYAQDVAAVVLLLCMIALRVQVARILSTFNADNANAPLGPAAISHDSPLSPPLILQANTGTEFSTICIAAVILLVLAWLERRRLTAEIAAMPSSSDVETPYREKAAPSSPSKWQTLFHTPLTSGATTPPRASTMKISAPIAMTPVRSRSPSQTSNTPSPTKSAEIPPTPMHDAVPWTHAGVRRIVLAPPTAQ
ncbi:hypothetical protein ACI68E_003260 [Malassezia pachydermatis]|uniref:Membrane-associated protein n=1 Tax=Malassezia pachydermatis TaxID=77020 RepID=A0A0M9VPG8_9BASI|nr:hypothetical protein Malapachy_4101 [Malassezia pachydermatis]KOS14435.1 hypothetical protein Malapachy_4101 [Malassezia pachydermatis]